MTNAPTGASVAARDLSRRREAPTGFTASTRILCAQGLVAINCLAPGDRIITRDLGMVRLISVRSTIHKEAETILLSSQAFGHMRPKADMLIGPAQRLLLRDWRANALFGATNALVPAARLIDGTYIKRMAPEPRLRLYSLRFDRPHVIYAEGVECAT